MRRHELKIWPEYFVEIAAGRKTFEIRNNDRAFAVGDALVLREWNLAAEIYTGREERREVSYILKHHPTAGCAATFGLQPGYVILGLKSIGAPAPTVAYQALALTDAAIKDAVTEYLLHRGEQPYRVLRGGSELWETHVPAMKAAFEAVGRLHATAMTEQPVSDFDSEAWRYRTDDAPDRGPHAYDANCECVSCCEAFLGIAQAVAAPPSPDTVREAAQAVIDRWETPAWKDRPATATYINALRAALASAPVAPAAPVAGTKDQWQDISTAPKDGREVILQVKLRAGIRGKCLVGHYMPGGHCISDHPPIDQGWYFWNGCYFDKAAEPVAWMPLPETLPHPRNDRGSEAR